MNPQLEYEEAVRANPADPLPRLRLGQIFLAQNQLEAARECFDTVLKIKPGSREAQKGLAKILYVQKKYNESIALYEKLLEADFKDAQTHFDLGLAHYENGRPDLFSRECVKALTVDPFFAKAHFVQGILYAKAGKNDAAVRELKAGLKINAADPQAHYTLAKIYHLQNKEEDCIFECMETLKYDPQHVGAHFFLGEILYKHEDYGLALKKFNECLALKPDLSNLKALREICFKKTEEVLLAGSQNLEGIAQFYFENKLYDLAISFLKKALQKSPKREDLILNLSHVYEISGDFKMAYQTVASQKQHQHAFEIYERHLQSVILKNPQARDSRVQLAELYVAEDRLIEALEEYQNYFRTFPDDFRIKPKYQEIVSLFKKQTEEFKNRPDLKAVYSFRLGYVALAENQWERAQEIFESLLKQYPSDAGMYYALIRTFQAQGAYRPALEYCRALKKINAQYRYLPQIELDLHGLELDRLKKGLAGNLSLDNLKELVQICFDQGNWGELIKYATPLKSYPDYAREVWEATQQQLRALYFKGGLNADESLMFARILEFIGNPTEALAVVKRLLRDAPGSQNLMQRAQALAQTALQELTEDSVEQLYERARIFSFLKQPDLSLAALRKLKVIDAKSALRARFDADFQNLFANAEFQNLVTAPGSSKVDTQK